jgi:3,4-dihydroxy-2-butanone 4-phosphate synthase
MVVVQFYFLVRISVDVEEGHAEEGLALYRLSKSNPVEIFSELTDDYGLNRSILHEVGFNLNFL